MLDIKPVMSLCRRDFSVQFVDCSKLNLTSIPKDMLVNVTNLLVFCDTSVGTGVSTGVMKAHAVRAVVRGNHPAYQFLSCGTFLGKLRTECISRLSSSDWRPVRVEASVYGVYRVPRCEVIKFSFFAFLHFHDHISK